MNFIESILYFQPLEGKEKEVEDLVIKATKTIQNEEGCLFYGGFKGETTGLVRVRGGFAGAESFALHVQREQETMAQLMTLGNITKMQVHGPAETEALIAPLVEARGGQYFTMGPGFSRLPNKAMENAVDIVPYFTINEGKLDEMKALWPKFVAVTEPEKRNLYYGFSSKGNIARCIEAYLDAEGVFEHLGHVGELLEQGGKISTLDLEIHGPAEEIEKIREPTKAVGPRMYILFTGYGKA